MSSLIDRTLDWRSEPRPEGGRYRICVDGWEVARVLYASPAEGIVIAHVVNESGEISYPPERVAFLGEVTIEDCGPGGARVQGPRRWELFSKALAGVRHAFTQSDPVVRWLSLEDARTLVERGSPQISSSTPHRVELVLHHGGGNQSSPTHGSNR